eukprot:PhM_4_TR1204/c0_g1_i1/m.20715
MYVFSFFSYFPLSLPLFSSMARCRRHALGSVEQVDWVRAIRDEVALQTEALQQPRLQLRTRPRHRLDRGAPNSRDGLLELIGLDARELLRFVHLQFVELALVVELGGLALCLQVHLQVRGNAGALCADLGELHLRLRGDELARGVGLGLGLGGAGALNRRVVGLELEHGLAVLLGVGLVLDDLTLEATAGGLLEGGGGVAGGRLLGLGRDFDGQLHRLRQRLAGLGVDGVNAVDINVVDDEAVRVEVEAALDVAVDVAAENRRLDDQSGVLVERVEALGGDGGADTTGHGLAGVADEIRDGEGAVGVRAVDVEVPVVR